MENLQVETREVGFAEKFKAAVALIESVTAITVITDKHEYEAAALNHKTLIEFEKQLEDDYKEHPVIKAAKTIQEIKSDLAARLKAAKTGIKNGPMWAFEQAEEKKRLAEEERLRKIEEKRVQDEREAAAKLAQQKADEDAAAALAAAQAAQAAGQTSTAEAHLEAALEIEQQGKEAVAEIVAAPVYVPAVVIPKTTPTVAGRRMVKKWRITLKNGNKLTSDEFQKKTLRIPVEELAPLPASWFMLNHTAVSAKVESMGKAAEIPGTLEVWEVPA